jgi:hypothetical protein
MITTTGDMIRLADQISRSEVKKIVEGDFFIIELDRKSSKSFMLVNVDCTYDDDVEENKTATGLVNSLSTDYENDTISGNVVVTDNLDFLKTTKQKK